MDPYVIEKNSEFGRYLVAARDLKPGEYLFEDLPFAVGPKARSQCCCLECYRPVDGTAAGTRCERCSWPLCGDCSQLSEFSAHERECEIFGAAKCKFFNLPDASATCIQLDCVTPLRVLLAREANAQHWSDEVAPMEDHREKRFGITAWSEDEQNVVAYLMGPCKLAARGVTPELIQKVIGILEVNAFEAKTVDSNTVRCLYTKLAISSHSCTPNTTHAIHPSDNFRMHVRATRAIDKGSQLFSCYTYTLSGTLDRQRHLMEGKFFQCRCERCLDPTELDTHFSSLKCSSCLFGDVSTTNPLDADAIWRCNKCPMESTADAVKESLKALQGEVECRKSVEFLESSLEEYEGILHPNHYIMTSMKSALVDAYGHLRGYLLTELPELYLRRKIDLCEDLLSLLDIFESGKSRARAMMLYELHAPMVLFAKSQFEIDHMNEEEYFKHLLRAREIINESKEILDWEDESVCVLKKFARMSLEYIDGLIEKVK